MNFISIFANVRLSFNRLILLKITYQNAISQYFLSVQTFTAGTGRELIYLYKTPFETNDFLLLY
jgi:hypothetical protein